MKEKYIPQVGDIVGVRWMDHYRFKGDKPKPPMEVISWGKVYDNEDPDYLTIIQNEVQNSTEVQVERIMDGQAILKTNIVEVKKL